MHLFDRPDALPAANSVFTLSQASFLNHKPDVCLLLSLLCFPDCTYSSHTAQILHTLVTISTLASLLDIPSAPQSALHSAQVSYIPPNVFSCCSQSWGVPPMVHSQLRTAQHSVLWVAVSGVLCFPLLHACTTAYPTHQASSVCSQNCQLHEAPDMVAPLAPSTLKIFIEWKKEEKVCQQ